MIRAPITAAKAEATSKSKAMWVRLPRDWSAGAVTFKPYWSSK